MTIHRGVHRQLEDEANRLLVESLRGVRKYSDKADILTPWKEKDRRKREILVAGGIADSTVRSGNFRRAFNPARPELNSRPGRHSSSARGLAQFVRDHGVNGEVEP